MPAIRRGKQGGIKQFLKGRKSYKTTHTMSRSKSDFVTFDIWIICKDKKGKSGCAGMGRLQTTTDKCWQQSIKLEKSNRCDSNRIRVLESPAPLSTPAPPIGALGSAPSRGQNGIEYYVYVTYKVNTNLNHIHQCYRQRFGIESSYRLNNLCRIRTTTKKPTWRLLFVGISFLLVNIWVNLLWRKISKPRRGGRLIDHKIFPLKQMLSFLTQAVERLFQGVQTIYVPLE